MLFGYLFDCALTVVYTLDRYTQMWHQTRVVWPWRVEHRLPFGLYWLVVGLSAMVFCGLFLLILGGPVVITSVTTYNFIVNAWPWIPGEIVLSVPALPMSLVTVSMPVSGVFWRQCLPVFLVTRMRDPRIPEHWG